MHTVIGVEDEAPPTGTTPEDHLQAHLLALAPFDVKLRSPDLRGRSIPREGLPVKVIEDADLVVIVAGAGYGKTTLLAQWAEAEGSVAWLTLGREDNDPATLVAYLLRSLQSVWHVPDSWLDTLAEPGASHTTILLPRMSRLIDSIRGAGVLVLDDIHEIDDVRCLRILEAVIESAPPGLVIHIAGRTLPPLGLHRLRTRRRVIELDERDLAFSESEAQALASLTDVPPDHEQVLQILQVTEGWPAGIYLMALSTQPDPQVQRTTSPVGGYLREQVLAGIDAMTVDFLMQTSVLDNQDGSACDVLLSRGDSSSILAQLAESHLFVVPVEGKTGSYRYHALLSEVLRSEHERRDPTGLRHLHARASDYFAERGEWEASVRHALKSGDGDRAARLVWEYLPLMLGIGKGSTVASWLAFLNDADYDTSPVFALARALTAGLAGDGRGARLWLDMARRHRVTESLPDNTPVGYYIRVLEAATCDRGVRAMVQSAEQALSFEMGDNPLRVLALYLAGSGLGLLGDLETAVPYLDEALDIGLNYPAAAVSALSQKALIGAITEEWDEARRHVQRASQLYEHFRMQNLPFQAHFPAVAALMAVHDGRLEEAESYAARGRALLAMMTDLSPWMVIETAIILGRVELRLGHRSAAFQLAREARTALEHEPDAPALATALVALDEALSGDRRQSVESREALTTAEIRVLSFLPTHLTLGQIAGELCVSINTVKSQIKAIYRKLDVASRTEAVQEASALGLLGRTRDVDPGLITLIG